MPSVLDSLKVQSQKDIRRGLHLLLAGDENPRQLLINLSLETKLAVQAALFIVEKMPEELVEQFMESLDDPDKLTPSALEIAEALVWAKQVNPENLTNARINESH